MKKISLTVLFFVCVSNIVAYEINLEEQKLPNIDIHGFFSQGYMESERNNYFQDTSKGTEDMREYGINFSSNITDSLYVGAQLIGYTLGDQGADHVTLHWALADYCLNDNLGIRAGRVRMPFGFYNEVRDIDMTRVSVFLPRSIYPEIYHEVYSAYDGVSIYGSVELGQWGSLYYTGGVGKIIDDEDDYSGFRYHAKGLGFSDFDTKVNNAYNAQAIWTTPLDGLRVGYTWRRIDTETHHHNFPAPGVTTAMDYNNYNSQIVSAEYTLDKLVLMGEYVENRNDDTLSDTGWYVGGTYECTDKLAVGSYWSRYQGDYDPANIGGQDTFSVFSRYQVADNWIIKGQVDFIEGTSLVSRSDVDPDPAGSGVLYTFKSTWFF